MGIFNSNSDYIAEYLYGCGATRIGVAGILGNLYQESQFVPYVMEGDIPLSNRSTEYTNKVNSKVISKNEFMHDSIGYGLAGFTWYELKQWLYEATVEKGISIGDLSAQTAFLVSDLKRAGFWSKINGAASYTEATTIMMLQYERPADQSNTAQQTRIRWAAEAYDYYKGQSSPPQTSTAAEGLIAVATAEYEGGSSSLQRVSENLNKYTKWFYGDNTAAEWCAIFCSYCLVKAGLSWPFPQEKWQMKNGMAYVPYVTTLAKSYGAWVDADKIQPGDLIIYSNNNHIGIAVSGSGQSVATIEGNTNNDAVNYYSRPNGSLLGGVRISGTSTLTLLGGAVSYEKSLSVPSSSSSSSNSSYSAIEYKTVTSTVKTTDIVTAEAEANTARTKSTSLLTTPTLVESPNTSPVERISGPSTGSTSWNILNGNTASFTP